MMKRDDMVRVRVTKVLKSRLEKVAAAKGYPDLPSMIQQRLYELIEDHENRNPGCFDSLPAPTDTNQPVPEKAKRAHAQASKLSDRYQQKTIADGQD